MAFEPKKESFNIISRATPFGNGFTLLGVHFDTGLTMTEAVNKLHWNASWKLRSLLRCRRYYDTTEIISMYKAKILSYLEYRTPAVYHATATLLSSIDNVQEKMLREVEVSSVDALLHYHLAPLIARRDRAMLGLIHRSVLGLGPSQFHNFFKKKNWRLCPS